MRDTEDMEAEAGFDDGDEPSFSDPEDFEDDISDQELLEDVLRDRPQEADGIDSVIVVDNVPQVGPERLEKLKNVVQKIFSKFGKITNEFYPEAEGKTKGYIFLEYAAPSHAQEAVKNADGYKLDKQHTFRVNLFTDFDKYMNISDEWEAPEKQPFKDFGNLRHWMEDPDCRDQYSVIYESGERTGIFSNDAKEAITVEERARWTETYVRWSPKGTYLATFHQRGIALWGGEKFKQIQRFSHQGVQLIDFSPCERYVVTFSPLMDTKDDPQAIIIWDVLTGQKKRGFHCESSAHWPIFKWSHDGKFFARMTQDTLSIYETPSMGLLDKKSLKINGIKDFSWSPGDNIIAFWVPEDKDIPARVTLMQLPSRHEIRVRNLFNVVDCKLHWQKNGDYLCVKVDRTPKGTQGVVTNFEIFRMREKQVPVDVVEMKESIIAFAWEPNGSKFAVLHGESPRINSSFYHVKNNGKIDLIKMFDKQQANSIFWSPQGQFLVLAGLRSMNGALAFVDTSDCTMMNIAEHYMASDVEWDPTGRYVVTSVSWWSHKVDNAFWLWTFQGRLLQKNNKDRFCQLLWRPRPPSLISQEQIKLIKKDLKKYSKIFEQKDRLSQSKASKELVDKRRTMMEDYRKYREAAQQMYQEQRPLRLQLRGGVDTDELDSNVEDWEEETIEFFISEEIIPLGDLE
ncbi:eukaryotic translation initiation factor 3, subunit Ba [Denticeps clupeoides]|uniref:Eukaryotic translation initiation factor 3 subunit B n=1 Tax=Denticeps clupeoides TaxID=299321 RepID=A0A8C4A463_9TELE|nr:eukaryotic translation initiation factor 3 subunit B [Denticeps clupeoides]XP_028825039.1 eukaryotic translation initiation factor 3 subunit B [Denticeps clupeoides]XP_028842273.1 eukaryotic translation initiation factor 3 subunit B [Denticeps clupeoides]XP_028842274.1 eukaryotic translation initiation factor 3 subunit B [Denticeps clupeoides]